MRNNAIMRIILWSSVLLILFALLGAALFLNNRPFRDHQPDPTAPTYSTPVVEFSPDEVSKLEIQWVSGNIRIQPDETVSTIQVSEQGVTDNSDHMICRHSGDTLTIQFRQDAAFFSFPSFGFNFRGSINKDLTILVPVGWICQELDVEAASADLEISDLTMGKVDMASASGKCTFTNCTVDMLDVETASGDVRFSGSLRELDCEAASASFYAELTNTPSRMDMDVASGDMELVLPEDTGFRVDMDGLSSDFSSEFPTELRNGSHVYGDGRCQISVDGVSGDVIIRKAHTNS